MKKTQQIIWSLVGLVFFVFIFTNVQNLFKVAKSRAFQSMRGLYEEKKNSLDAIVVGASTVHCFWQPPLAWDDYGITTMSLSVGSLPVQSIKYWVIEARKTQPDALYIVPLNTYKSTSVKTGPIHRSGDFMVPSVNKYQMILDLCDEAYLGLRGSVEYIFPIIRFHPRWSELDSGDFLRSLNRIKGGWDDTKLFSRIQDFSEKYIIHDEEAEPSAKKLEILDEFLDYCDREKVNVLFVNVPQSISSNNALGQLNYLERYIQERGYPCLDLLKIVDEMGINRDIDFYNKNHTNLHGSIKFTDYLAQYLVDVYQFEDKRGRKEFESWDTAAELYEIFIGPHTLPLEREHALRDYDLALPKISSPVVGEDRIELTWNSVSGADAYDIYRRSSAGNEKSWSLLAEVDGDAVFFADMNLSPQTSYTYTVVPVRHENGKEYYGKFSYAGVNASSK